MYLDRYHEYKNYIFLNLNFYLFIILINNWKNVPIYLLTLFLEKEFNVEVKVIQADFSKGQTIFNHIAEKLEGIEIGILGSWRVR